MKKGLGRGLEALLGESSDAGSEENMQTGGIVSVKINEIEPNTKQPRKSFNDDALEELSYSIKKHGIVQPIITRREHGIYKIIAGERRWRAAKKAGLKEVPVIVKEATDRQLMEIALIENLQREDLNVIEEANAYKQLTDEYSMTHNDIADIIGKSRADITNKLRLLRLPAEVLERIESGTVTAGHARALLSLDHDNEIITMSKLIETRQMSVRETENQVKRLKTRETAKTPRKQGTPEMADIQERMTRYFEAKVRIISVKKGHRIVIDCPDDDILNSIIEKLEV